MAVAAGQVGVGERREGSGNGMHCRPRDNRVESEGQGPGAIDAMRCDARRRDEMRRPGEARRGTTTSQNRSFIAASLASLDCMEAASCSCPLNHRVGSSVQSRGTWDRNNMGKPRDA